MSLNNDVDAVYHEPMLDDTESTILLPKKGFANVSYRSTDDYDIESTSSIDSFENHELTDSRKTEMSQHTLLLSLAEKLSADRGSTLFLTVCSLMQTLQGSAILGIPFAYLVGGFSFLPAGIFIAVLAEISARLLIDCLYEVSPRSGISKRIYEGYDDLALACWGRIGSGVVRAMNLVYFIMNNVVNVVLLFKTSYNLLGAFVPLTQTQIGCLVSILLIPFLFIKKLSFLGYLGFFATISVIVACLTSIVVFIQHAHDWSDNFKQVPVFNLEEYPVAIGIMMYTLIIAPTLPNVEATMTDRKQLPVALHISFAFSIVFKSFYGIIGVLTFGLATKQLIATNVSDLSVPSRYIMSIMLMIYAICNTSFFNYLILERVDRFMHANVTTKIKSGEKLYIPWTLLSRPLCVLMLIGVSLVMPFFALVSGVVGAFNGCFTALLVPIIFHLQLKRNELTTTRKVMEISLLVLSVFIWILTTYSSVNELVKAIASHHEL